MTASLPKDNPSARRSRISSEDRARQMRDHVGVDPEAIAAGTTPANRADRRLALRIAADIAKRNAKLLNRLDDK